MVGQQTSTEHNGRGNCYSNNLQFSSQFYQLCHFSSNFPNFLSAIVSNFTFIGSSLCQHTDIPGAPRGKHSCWFPSLSQILHHLSSPTLASWSPVSGSKVREFTKSVCPSIIYDIKQNYQPMTLQSTAHQ